MGAQATKNVRRVGIPATIKGKPNPEWVGVPTAQRLAAAGDNFTIGGDERTGRRYVMHDNPLDRALRKGIISGAEHSALSKYHHHWHHAGLESGVGSADLNRVFASDPGSMSGMAKTEAQAHHRKQWRDARAALGHRAGIVIDNIVCAGHSLETAGFSIGWTNKPQAIAAATEMLRDAGYRLAKLWGIG
jgi:hypothetical protein